MRLMKGSETEIGVRLKGQADQISDAILRRLAQVFALLAMLFGNRCELCEREERSRFSPSLFPATISLA